MALFTEIRLILGRWFRRRQVTHQKLATWYTVRWDEDQIYRAADPPGGEPWEDSLEWSKIVRICFVAEDFAASDGIYIFTSERRESYAIPTEAQGGAELWGEILRRGLFDVELAMEAATSVGGIFCWPEAEGAVGSP